MSAKYHQSAHVHPFPWSEVAAAIFRRYPNPFSTHVLSEDTVYRSIRRGGRVLYTRRLITKTNRLPSWGHGFFSSNFVPLVEESTVDRVGGVITTYTRNVGLSRFMSAVERVRYTPHPERPGETLAVKEAWIESGLYGLRSAVKSFGIERFKQNCQRATDGFNVVLAQLSGMRAKGGELRDKAKLAAEVARAHTTLHAYSHRDSQK